MASEPAQGRPRAAPRPGTMLAEKDGPIGWIPFDNPARRNAVSLAMWQALQRIVGEFEADSAIRVIVLKGAGDMAFVSGAGISEFGEKRFSPETVGIYNRTAEEATEALKQVGKPTIAMVRGFCIGGRRVGGDVVRHADRRRRRQVRRAGRLVREGNLLHRPTVSRPRKPWR